MSLDVVLEEVSTVKHICSHCEGRGYYLLKDEVFDANITHNLRLMAQAANLYQPLWRPTELGIVTANDLVPHLKEGLRVLATDSAYFKSLGPSNQWGSYDDLVSFVTQYLTACYQYPTAKVHVY